MPIGAQLTEQDDRVTVCYYSKEGRGKTTNGLKATLIPGPGRVLLINAEAGAKLAALRKQGVDVSLVDTWPESPAGMTLEAFDAMLEELRAELRADPTAYKAIVVDSYSELARRFIDQISAEARAEAQRKGKRRDRFQVTLEDHGTNSQMLRWLLRQFRDLDVHLAITALERRDVDDDGLVSYGPLVGPAVASDLAGLVDIVCYCDLEEIGDDVWFVGSFQPQARRRAKDRFGVLPRKLVNPTMDRIHAYVTGAMTRDNDPERARFLDALDAAAGEAPAPGGDTTGGTAPEEAPEASSSPSETEEALPADPAPDNDSEPDSGAEEADPDLVPAGAAATRPSRRR